MRKSSILLTVAILLITMAASAHALSIRVYDGKNVATVADESPTDFNSAIGAVTYIGAMGAFKMNVATGASYPILGSTTLPWLHLGSMHISSSFTQPNSLFVYLTDTNFVGSSGGFFAGIGGITGGTVRYQTYYDAGNDPFAMTTLLTEALYEDAQFKGLDTALFEAPEGPYSLTLALEIIHGVGIVGTSFDADIQPVPEPGTVLLLGCGLFGLAVYCRRRRQE